MSLTFKLYFNFCCTDREGNLKYPRNCSTLFKKESKMQKCKNLVTFHKMRHFQQTCAFKKMKKPSKNNNGRGSTALDATPTVQIHTFISCQPVPHGQKNGTKNPI